jgi:hypothetical protein
VSALALRVEHGAWDTPRAPHERKAQRAKALERDVEPTPCDGCEHRVRCGRERLACAAFAVYASLRGGWRDEPRIPSRARFTQALEGLDRFCPVQRGS